MLSRLHRSIKLRDIQAKRPLTVRAFSSKSSKQRLQSGLSILAIETSCDDSSVAVLSLEHGTAHRATSFQDATQFKSVVNFHKTVTAQSQQYNGIHPLVALASHNAALANLVHEACRHMKKDGTDWKPSLISVTRGPGMRSNLAVGLCVAKGLAVAWDVPLIGTHHMQAHALTARLCWTLQHGGRTVHEPTKQWPLESVEPRFPYLTVLVSGGHTMLLQSNNLVQHDILAESTDIALGDCLDKAARAILPKELCNPPYGRALESYAFPNGASDYNYTAPRSRQEELQVHQTKWDWSLRHPLQDKSGEKTSRRMQYSFSGLLTSVERSISRASAASEAERRDMAREVLRVSFEHLVSRMLQHLSTVSQPPQTIVVSGGVASNMFLRHVLREMLDARGYTDIETVFPPVELCTDNALMIAWAGFEMYAAGYSTSLDVEPIRKWSMDSRADDGGILGAPGWLRDAA